MDRREFDIYERASRFGESVILFTSNLPTTPISAPLISQLVRSGTSIGANLSEADESDTEKEFLYRLSLARREAKETQHWLRMMATAVPERADQGRELWKEADQIIRILATIGKKIRLKAK